MPCELIDGVLVVSPAPRLRHQGVLGELIEQYWTVEPGDTSRMPSIEVYDLVDGAYVLQVNGKGDDQMAIAGPVPVTVCPNDLVIR